MLALLLRDMLTCPSSHARRSRVGPTGGCDASAPAQPCRACAQLDPVTACDHCINRAAGLFSAGKDPPTIARLMAIKQPRAEYLVAIAQDREERHNLTVNTVTTAGLRALVATATRCDKWAKRPSPANIDAAQIAAETIAELSDRLRGRRPLTTAEIVRGAGYNSITTLKRDLGILKQPARKPTGQAIYNDELDVDAAGRIVRALGINPCEVPWL